jgi:uncharacterized protein (TIGR04255 family)
MIPGSRYSRPPIVEAILDIQVDLPGDFETDSLLKCQGGVKGDYPAKSKAQNITGEVSIGQKLSTSASAEAVGFIFRSADGTRMFQAKRQGFTFNWLAPYPGWDTFFPEAKRLWEEYRRVTRPRGYKRAALRYINRFDFPVQMLLLEDYFRTYPEVSHDLPQVMDGFFYQFNLPISDIEAAATITQTMVTPREPGHTSVILDIDLFRTGSLPPGNELWPLFETLRVWKNKIFEACLTDRAREVIR